MRIHTCTENNVVAALKFLAPDPKHETEKPFAINYTPHEPLPERNFDEERVNGIVIEDVRPIKSSLTLDEHGVSVLDLHCDMLYEDYFDYDTVKRVYGEEIRNLLLERLGARRVYFHECVVSSPEPSSFSYARSLKFFSFMRGIFFPFRSGREVRILVSRNRREISNTVGLYRLRTQVTLVLLSIIISFSGDRQ